MNNPDPVRPSGQVAAAGGTSEANPEHAAALRPQQAAIALAYGRDDAAPRVLAKGRGLVAQAIIERAHQHDVFVHESKELVALLMQVDLDQRIPSELYRAVAELLVWVYRLEQQGLTPAAAATGDPLALRGKS